MLTGTAGTGKTIVAANFTEAACQHGERALFFSFEESPNQIIRNMHSIGLRMEPLVRSGLLPFHSARPSLYGLEMHLATMFKEIAAFQPHAVIIDPITSLTQGGHALQQSEAAMSSLMDSWRLLQDLEGNGERNRVLYVLKARGTAHSNQGREFLISNRALTSWTPTLVPAAC